MKGFWFAPESPRILACLRIGLALVLLYDAARHWPYAIELYSSDGLPLPLFPNTSFQPAVPSGGSAVILQTLLIFSLLMLAFGYEVPVNLWISAILMGWLGLLDFPGTLAKYTVIAMHLLVLLSFSKSGWVWSLQSLVERSQCGSVPVGGRVAAPLDPNVCVQRVSGCRHHQTANAGVSVLENCSHTHFLDDRWGGSDWGLMLATHPAWVRSLSLVTVLFELLFPFLVWVPQLRRTMWSLSKSAVSRHDGLVDAHVSIFSPVMFAAALGIFSTNAISLLCAYAPGNGLSGRNNPLRRWWPIKRQVVLSEFSLPVPVSSNLPPLCSAEPPSASRVMRSNTITIGTGSFNGVVPKLSPSCPR